LTEYMKRGWRLMDKCRITAVELNNIKSYRSARIDFDKGITVIGGENGAGKSTIFEAIGHCLFGVKTRNFIGKADNFLREGARSGFINVFFTDCNGKEYKVFKDLKSRPILFELTGSDEWFPVENVSVGKLLRLSGNTPLDQMFTDIIGPFQADFIGPFMHMGATRKNHFDKILGISQWRDLYDKTQFFKRDFERRIGDLEKDLEYLEKNVKELPEKEKKLKEDREKRKELKVRIEEINKKIKEAEEVIGKQEALKKEMDGFRKKETTLVGEVGGKRNLLVEKRKLLESALKSLEIIEKARLGFTTYTQQEKIKKQLEKDLKEKNKLTKNKTQVEKSAARLSENINTRNTRAAEDREKNQENLSLTEQSLNETSADLETASGEENDSRISLDGLRKIQKEIQSADIDIISRKIDSVESLLSRILALEKSIKKRMEKLGDREEISREASKLENLEERKSRVSDEISSCKARIKSQKEGKRKLQEGLCPYMGEKCKNLGDRDPGKFFDYKIVELNEKIKALEEEKRQLEDSKKKAASAKERLIALKKEEEELLREQKEIGRIGEEIKDAIKVSDLKDIFSSIAVSAGKKPDDKIESLLASLKNKIDRFSFPQDQSEYPLALNKIYQEFVKCRESILGRMKSFVELATGELEKKIRIRSGLEKELENLKKERRKLEKESKRIDSTLKKIAIDEKNLEKQNAEIKELEELLREFEGLEKLIQTADDSLEKHRGDYDLYNRNKKESEKVGQLKVSIENLEKSILECEEKIEKLKLQVKEIEEKFSQEHLIEARAVVYALRGELGSSNKEYELLGFEIDKLKDEIEKMKQVLSDIKKKKKEISGYKKSKEFAQFLRDQVFNNIALEVSKALRNDISIPASRIYRQISGGKSAEELFWDEGYSIVLKDLVGGRIRTKIDRQLSGGQLMTAVIALGQHCGSISETGEQE